MSRFCHFESKSGFNNSDPSLSLALNIMSQFETHQTPPESFLSKFMSETAADEEVESDWGVGIF